MKASKNYPTAPADYPATHAVRSGKTRIEKKTAKRNFTPGPDSTGAAAVTPEAIAEEAVDVVDREDFIDAVDTPTTAEIESIITPIRPLEDMERGDAIDVSVPPERQHGLNDAIDPLAEHPTREPPL